MTYNDEQIATIEQLASIYMPIRDIALILEVDETALREDIQCQSNPASRAYRTVSYTHLRAHET